MSNDTADMNVALVLCNINYYILQGIVGMLTTVECVLAKTDGYVEL